MSWCSRIELGACRLVAQQYPTSELSPGLPGRKNWLGPSQRRDHVLPPHEFFGQRQHGFRTLSKAVQRHDQQRAARRSPPAREPGNGNPAARKSVQWRTASSIPELYHASGQRIVRNWPFMRLFAARAAAVRSSPLASPQNGTLPRSKSLSYSIEWRLITAGKARLDWTALPGRRGGWEAKLHLESVGLVSKLFKVEDDYTATYNQALCVQSSALTTHEGSPPARDARHLRRRLEEGVVSRTRSPEEHHPAGAGNRNPPAVSTTSSAACIFCAPSTSSRARPCRSRSATARRAVMARVEAQQREEVKTPAGTFKTIRYELFLFNNVLYQRSAHLYVWVTDDARKTSRANPRPAAVHDRHDHPPARQS